jgi:hypothetical protein
MEENEGEVTYKTISKIAQSITHHYWKESSIRIVDAGHESKGQRTECG